MMVKTISRGLAAIIILACGFANGAEKPSWTSHTPTDPAKTLFFVGRSPNVSSEAEGIRMASKDAREQLLRQEFGTTIRVDTTQKETLNDVSLDSQLSEISDLILLKGFKQTDVYTEKDSDKIEVWALFSVPKSEIKEEKERVVELQKQKRNFSNVQASEAPSKEFDNGGKPKLKKGIKKSQVITMFGKPDEVDTSNAFIYSSPDICKQSSYGSSYLCYIYFENGRVNRWLDVISELTSDLDDEPTPSRSVKIKKKISMEQAVAQGEIKPYLISMGCTFKDGKIRSPASKKCDKAFESTFFYLAERNRLDKYGPDGPWLAKGCTIRGTPEQPLWECP